MSLLNKAVDIFLGISQRVPPIVLHNVEKSLMLKQIFWHLAVDGHAGNYIEFGVANGNSLKAAVLANENAKSKIIGVRKAQRNFFGFDTFEFFNSNTVTDFHPTWQGNRFNIPYTQVQKRFKKFSNVQLVKADVLQLHEKFPNQKDLFSTNDSAAVIFFDMDLYAPTFAALEWCSQLIQQGTFLIFDELFAFSGDSSKGEAAALSEFLKTRQDIHLRLFSHYGAGGTVYIVDIKK